MDNLCFALLIPSDEKLFNERRRQSQHKVANISIYHSVCSFYSPKQTVCKNRKTQNYVMIPRMKNDAWSDTKALSLFIIYDSSQRNKL